MNMVNKELQMKDVPGYDTFVKIASIALPKNETYKAMRATHCGVVAFDYSPAMRKHAKER